MEKYPENNKDERYSDAKKWFTGTQEELKKERQKTQEDYNREEEGKHSLIDLDKLKKDLEKERAKTQEDYDNE